MKFDTIKSKTLKQIILLSIDELPFIKTILDYSLKNSSNDAEFIILFGGILSKISGTIDFTLTKLFLSELKLYDVNIEMSDIYNGNTKELLERLKFARSAYNNKK